MHLISKYNRFIFTLYIYTIIHLDLHKGFCLLFCAINIYSKYAWVVPLKDKKDITFTNTIQKLPDESNRKPYIIWVNRDSEFYKRSMKSWLKDHDIKIYSTHNEGKSVVAERFMRTLKNKTYKYMTSVPKNVYTDKLDNIANRYNSTYQTKIKMKPLDLKSNTYIYSGIENNAKHSKFKVGDHVRIENYKNIFTKVYVPDWSEEILLL